MVDVPVDEAADDLQSGTMNGLVTVDGSIELKSLGFSC